MKPKNIHVICPVANLTENEERLILSHTEALEREGHTVRCPFRDTNQHDEIGLRIIAEHEDDILWANEIHIWWNPTSKGSLWDLAQARMAQHFHLDKKIILINVDWVEVTKDKSHTNVLLAMHFGLFADSTLADLKRAKAKKG